jgi:hypothetical protein
VTLQRTSHPLREREGKGVNNIPGEVGVLRGSGVLLLEKTKGLCMYAEGES